jgi:hypothetical protein
MQFNVVAIYKVSYSLPITADDPDKAFELALDTPREQWVKGEMEEFEIEAVEHVYDDEEIIDAEIVEE